MRIILSFIVLIPLTSYGQFKLSGVVRDSITKELMPGVNVSINKMTMTSTDSVGEFEINSNTSSAEVTFSFIGLRSKTQIINADERSIIDLSVDTQSIDETPNYFIKTSLEAGYYGDKKYAPTGFIINYSLQSIGRTSFNINSNLKYWEAQENSGLEFSVSKDLTDKINYLPDNLFLSYKSIQYGKQKFNLRQTRGFLANELGRDFFAIDIGGAYNELIKENEEGTIQDSYFSGIVGLTKIFSSFSFLNNWGFYANINYNPDWAMYEIGTYKGIYIRKLPEIVIMGKYYNYGDIEGVQLSIRLNIFSTRYYCCHSWMPYYNDINALK